MTINIIPQFLFKVAVTLGVVATLTACGGGGGGSSSTPVVTASSASSQVAVSSVVVSTSTSSLVASSISSAGSSVSSNVSSLGSNSSANKVSSSLSSTNSQAAVSSAAGGIVNSSSQSRLSSSSSSLALDTTPDAFSFSPANNAALSSDITSDAVTISGINAPADISISGGLYSVDGGAFTNANGKIIAGQKVVVKVKSSSSLGTVTKASLTIGGVASDFTVTTLSADTTPDAFSFSAVTNAALSADITSSAITVSGINTPADISISGGLYSVDGAAFVSTSGKITNGQKVVVKVTASALLGTLTKATLTLGRVSGDFTVTTLPADTTPDAFSFSAVSNAALSADIISSAITVSGINASTDISISGGLYSVDGAAFVSTNGKIVSGQKVVVKATASASPATNIKATLTVGGVTGSFSVTTLPADTMPDAFSFSPAINAAVSTYIASSSVTISGINTSADISISGGLYSIDSAAFVSTAGKITNGQKVVVKVMSSAVPSSTTKVTLIVGGVSADFSVTTEAPDTTPNAFSFPDIVTTKLNASINSSAITISGINLAIPISITGGQYSIAGGAFTSAAGTVINGQAVTVKTTSAAGINSTMQAVLTVGGVTGAFSVTTTLQNTTPYSMGGAIQGKSLNISTVASTLAGTAPGADGIGPTANFIQPHAIIRDGDNLYVTDICTIRKIAISTGVVTTFAGSTTVCGRADGIGASARFNGPNGITTDGTNLYVADSRNFTIRKIVISTGVVTTLAGSATVGGSADGIGASARFNGSDGITTDGTNLYVADSYNFTIRKIVISTGVVTTLAGTAGIQGKADGTGAAAAFAKPIGITTDGTSLYVADKDNQTIRKIVISTGVVTTLAGNAHIFGNESVDGIGTEARFGDPIGVTTDGTNLYVADTWSSTIRKVVIATGVVTTLAGTSNYSGVTDGTGAAARFNGPDGITTDGADMYVVDEYNYTIRKIAISTGAVTTLAGRVSASKGVDGTGAIASFNTPNGITTDGANLYVADTDSSTIRKIVISTGEVTTLSGMIGVPGSVDGTGTAANFNGPHGITTDGTNLYVADTWNSAIRKIVISTGVVTTLAGGSYGTADGTGAAASFQRPYGITTDGINLYVADNGTSFIRKIVILTGAVTTLADSAAKFSDLHGITTDGTNLYVADSGSGTIRKIAISTGVLTTLAGTAGVHGSADGSGAAASFNFPQDVTTDGASLYVADTFNNTIRKIVISTGAVTTLAGMAGVSGIVDGVGGIARFYNPYGITTDGFDLFITDARNSTIRKIH